MRAFRLFILLVLCLPVTVLSETVIEFTDGTNRWRHEVIRYTKKQDAVGLADSLSLFLTDNGFLDSRVQPVRQESQSALEVEFGERYKIGKLIFQEDLLDTLDYNRPLSLKNVEYVIDSIIRAYQSQGYYFTSITPILYEKKEHSVDIHLMFRKGPPVTVSSVEIDGIRRTDTEFLRRYIPLEAGDTLQTEKIDKSARAIRKLDFVSLVGEPVVIPDAGYQTARIRYNLLEAKQFYFEGAGGYIPEGGGYFVWFLNLKGRNMFGSGQRAGLLMDRKEANKSIFSVYYGQPVFLLGSGEALLDLRTRDYRDQFYEFGVGLSYSVNATRDLTVESRIGWKNVEPADDPSRSFRVNEAGFGIRAGGIRNVKNAPPGFALHWRINYSGRRYGGKLDDAASQRTSFNDTRNELRAEIGIPVFSGISDYHCFEFKDIESSEKPLPVSELFLIGGQSTLRGYRNDQFSARRLALLKTELRFFLSSGDYIYPFADGAWFERFLSGTDSTVVKKDNFKWGYGMGIKLTSRNRYLLIELSWEGASATGEPRLNVTLADQF